MEVKTEIKLNKEELIELIKEKYQIEGDIEFLIEEETYKCGYNDEGNVYSTRYKFNGVKIKNFLKM